MYPLPVLKDNISLRAFAIRFVMILTKRNSSWGEKSDISHMKKFQTFFFLVLLYLSATFALAQNTVATAPTGAGATTIYRQVMPDGRVVYSDTLTKGVKVDRILMIPSSAKTQTAAKPASGERTRGAGNAGAAGGSGDTGR